MHFQDHLVHQERPAEGHFHGLRASLQDYGWRPVIVMQQVDESVMIQHRFDV